MRLALRFLLPYSRAARPDMEGQHAGDVLFKPSGGHAVTPMVIL